MALALVRKAVVAIFLMVGLLAGAWAQGLLPVPPLTAHVIDQTATLDAAQQGALEEKLAQLERDKGSQVVVLIVPTTAPEEIAAYANRVGNDWKLGRRDVGDGLIVVVAKDDHRMRIEVAKALEGAVPDIAAGRIIRDVMTPAFRRGDFAGGLDAAVDQLAARIRGEPLPEVNDGGSGTTPDDVFDLIIPALIAIPVLSQIASLILGRKLAALGIGTAMGALAWGIWGMTVIVALIIGLMAMVYALLAAMIERGGSGRSRGGGFGGSSGGFSSGGFSSGGGGDFGGGGASGSW